MRRYAVRFLVAVLTFGIGVVLSLAFGLFTVRDTAFVNREWSRPKSCSERYRLAQRTKSAFIHVDTRHTDPVIFAYLGTSQDASRGDEVRMRFSVENNSDKTVSSYWITASEIKDGVRKGLDWTAFEVLEPGQTSTISLPPDAEGSSLRVARVSFQDGSTWINPRASQ